MQNINTIKFRNEALYELLVPLAEKLICKYHRAEVNGLEKIPKGKGLFVGNHNSGTWSPDTTIFATHLFKEFGIEGVPYWLAHEKALKLPIIKFLRELGAINATHENAEKAFKYGYKVMVYPGGDYEAFRPFKDRNKVHFGGRKGYIKLALKNNVPIIPVVSAGAHSTNIVISDLKPLANFLHTDKLFRLKVFPLTLSFPLGLTLGLIPFYVPYPSKITIKVLNPIYFKYTGEKASNDENWVNECAEVVETRMQETLTKMTEK